MIKAISKRKGMLFPDVYITRSFFKYGLNKKIGRVVEYGCGTANNLILYKSFGWEVSGFDYSSKEVENANYNLGNDNLSQSISEVDLSKKIPELHGEYNAMLFAHIIYYLPRMSFKKLLRAISQYTSSGSFFFLSFRKLTDFRYGLGNEKEKNEFVLDIDTTGEKGLLNIFYEDSEMLEIIEENYGTLSDMHLLDNIYENVQNGQVIRNHDRIIVGIKK